MSKELQKLEKLIKKLEAEVESLKTPRATISYNLGDHYEREDFKASLNGPMMLAKIESLYEDVFRRHLRYGEPILKESPALTDVEEKIIREIWEKVNAHFND